jgi:phosphohistidine phosphatase SixA
MGELVREYGLIPDLVISSDAVRARLTAEALVEAARYAGEILLDQDLYMAGPADILARGAFCVSRHQTLETVWGSAVRSGPEPCDAG